MLLRAPAKLNLCLYLGRPREDGLHELCSLFEPLALADLIKVTPAERDEVICPGVEGENLAAKALAALRERGWEREPLRIEIEKRVPVAAGLGGGSGDAAAVLRLAAGEVADLPELAAALGADVPSQLRPALALVRGAGERIELLPEPVEHAAVLLPGRRRPQHRRGLRRGRPARARPRRRGARRAGGAPAAGRAGAGASPLDYPDLLVNDLEPAALSLRPGDRRGARGAARRRGAADDPQRLRPDRGRPLPRPRRGGGRRRGGSRPPLRRSSAPPDARDWTP